MKNIYHIAENVSYKSGGVRSILLLLNNYLNNNGLNSNIEKIILNSSLFGTAKTLDGCSGSR